MVSATGLRVGEMRFPSERVARLYADAQRMLDEEVERQKAEAAKLGGQWARLPLGVRRQRAAALGRHFAACREPYVKLAADLLALATPVFIIPAQPSE